MAVQFIINEGGKKTASIIPITEYEDLLHQHHLDQELTDKYKTMIDTMLDQQTIGTAQYVWYKNIKDRFQAK